MESDKLEPHVKHCSKAEFDAQLEKILNSTPSKKEFLIYWARPAPEIENIHECRRCQQWINQFVERTFALAEELEVTEEEWSKKKRQKIAREAPKIYFLNSIFHQVLPKETTAEPRADVEAQVKEPPVVNPWRVKGGDTASARAKTAVVQRLPLFLLCCGFMPIVGFIQGLILFPFGAVFGVVISALIMAGFVFRSCQYFFYFSPLGIGYKLAYSWLPILLVLVIAPVIFAGSLVYALISSLVLPAVWMIKYDTWLPAIAVLDWQYKTILPRIWEATFGPKGLEIAQQKRSKLEKGLRITLGVLLIVPLQALLLSVTVGPIFGMSTAVLILIGVPIRSVQWYWVYGAKRDWHLSTAPFWLYLSPFWLVGTLITTALAPLALFVGITMMLGLPFWIMLDSGDVFPIISGPVWIFTKALPKVYSNTLGEAASKRVRGERALSDLHCWWLPCIPFVALLGFMVWFPALFVLFIVRYIPFCCWGTIRIWRSWVGFFNKDIDATQRLSATCSRLGMILLALPLLLSTLLLWSATIPAGVWISVFLSLWHGIFKFPWYVLSGHPKRSYGRFWELYDWTNQHYFASKNHIGCLAKPEGV